MDKSVSQSETFLTLASGVRADLAEYSKLRALLEEQFDAALHHQSERLVHIAERMSAATDTLERRREERVALIRILLGAERAPSMTAVSNMLTETSRRVFDAWWNALESLVRECKTLNMRNCRLLTDQHEIMQRVLNGEADTYAPL